MRTIALTSRRLQAAALALLLVCAQVLVLGHEIGHGSGAEPDSCTICSIGGGLKQVAAAAEISPPYLAIPTSFGAHPAAPGAHIVPVPGPEARAPPRHS